MIARCSAPLRPYSQILMSNRVMQVYKAKDIYNPISSSKFIVNFDLDSSEQEQRAMFVIAHLKTLTQEALVEESIKFFKWIILCDVTLCNLKYATMLLEFFHKQGMLLHKQSVNNVKKQQTQRYLVMFSMNGHIFTKTYSSIRELRADTGKKPSQIQCMPTEEVFCKLLKKK
eukprot:COSAG05_NODE_1921_length_3832_cov_2.327083_3_plen_172_part_00